MIHRKQMDIQEYEEAEIIVLGLELINGRFLYEKGIALAQ